MLGSIIIVKALNATQTIFPVYSIISGNIMFGVDVIRFDVFLIKCVYFIIIYTVVCTSVAHSVLQSFRIKRKFTPGHDIIAKIGLCLIVKVRNWV